MTYEIRRVSLKRARVVKGERVLFEASYEGCKAAAEALNAYRNEKGHLAVASSHKQPKNNRTKGI